MKTQYPADAAKVVVRELLERLRGCVAANADDDEPWLKIAGSLRRRKPYVGDIEMVYAPAFGVIPTDLFPETGNLFEYELERLILDRVISPRKTANGQTMWGGKNKLAVHCASGIPVDFFATTIPDFHNYLVCRTGSAENNIRIATTAQQRGLKWMPYHGGFEVVNSATAGAALNRELRPGQVLRVTSEQDVFAFCGLPYLAPWER